MQGYVVATLAFGLTVAVLLPEPTASHSLPLPDAPSLPLYDLVSNSSVWLRTLPKSQADPESGLTAYTGDIRARLVVSEEDLKLQQGVVTTQIWWRRRDPRPENKSVIITNESGAIIPSNAHLVEAACGVISFAPPQPGTYFAYYLPYRRGGGGAHLHFQWYGCDAETPDCVLFQAPVTLSKLELVNGPPTCETVMPSMTGKVSWLENRPNAEAEKDHAVDGTPFNGFTPMELIALPSELRALPPNALNLFLEPRENMVRMFHAPTARWARDGEVLEASFQAKEAEFFTFQVGLYANGAPQQDVRVNFHGANLVQTVGLVGTAPSIPAEAFTCFNTGGVDQHGQKFHKQFSLGLGETGSLWIGVDIPTGAFGTYLATFSVSTNTTSARKLTATLNISKGAVSEHGDDDVYSLSRLRWLDSKIGVDGEAVWPRSRFANLTVQHSSSNGGFIVSLVNKDVTIGADGLPSMATVRTVKQRQGRNITRTRDILATPAQIIVLDAVGKPIQFTVDIPATITNHSSAAVSWKSLLVGGGVAIALSGRLEMDSYMTFEAMLSATSASTEVSDVQLVVAANGSVARRMFGMGSIGAPVGPLEWTWEKKEGIGNNRLWVGDVDAGLFLTPRGEGDDWVSPTYGKDYPVYPFLPPSWAGATAGPDSNSSIYGANLTLDFKKEIGGHDNTTNASIASAVVCTVFSGPRKLTGATQFLFDMMFTPSHPLDLNSHWKSRYLQIGYGGVQYTDPASVAATGVTVATLHQGIGGIHNGTMVNPYINYPFIPAVVDFMEGFTSKSHDLNMQVKFYYTIRELTNHAVELFALKALQGEILLDEDPYTIPQAGYCHDWDCHGGSAWLHQHMMNNYVYCWQQGLPNGEIDGAACDIGTSRWFNYYLEGLRRSVESPPHMDGIYYDGINFARDGMQRIRKTIDRAAALKKFRPLIDMHTGNGGANAPAGVRYIAHMAYADSLWNGEGFKWDEGSDYWLVEVSGLIHGITADRLGGPDSIKGMLYATYRRNSKDCYALWKFWDAVAIDRMEMIGYWEADPVVSLAWSGPDAIDLAIEPLEPSAALSSGNQTCKWKETVGRYIKGSGGQRGDIGFGSSCGPARPFDYPAMTVAQIQQKCCELGDGCVAFSWNAEQNPAEPGTACARKNWGDGSYDVSKLFNGYEKLGPHPPAPPAPPPPPPPGVCEPGSILATTYVQYKVRAVVVVSSWCPSPKEVELRFDWATLGMEPGAVSITQPAINGIQPAKLLDAGSSGAPVHTNVTDAVNGGVILVITPV